ncbi:MAG TPA: DUF1836 domain-containing protein [Candidatus Eisenbergiella stercoravium]|nr:DUF1836 domain-containing protein [Candidatus Eisenbergiella stercoravium]
MTIHMEDLLNSIMESFDRIDYIKAADIPNIDLYMDQVTTLMESRLKNTTRYPDQDKILTKTMINNYTKNNLLPPPLKKKYSREHVMILIFIYYYKGIMSISDIQTVLQPITERYFKKADGLTLEDIYEEVFSLEREQVEALKKDVMDKFTRAEKTFEKREDEEEDQSFLRFFAFICMLSFDVYVKRLLIEKLLDAYSAYVQTESGGAGKGKKGASQKEQEKEAD